MREHNKNEYSISFPKHKNSNYTHYTSFGAFVIVLVLLLFTSCAGKRNESSSDDTQKSTHSTTVGYTTTQTKSEYAGVDDDWGYDGNDEKDNYNDGEATDSSKEVVTTANEDNTTTPSSLDDVNTTGNTLDDVNTTGNTNGNPTQSSSPTVPDDDGDGDIYYSRPPGFVF